MRGGTSASVDGVRVCQYSTTGCLRATSSVTTLEDGGSRRQCPIDYAWVCLPRREAAGRENAVSGRQQWRNAITVERERRAFDCRTDHVAGETGGRADRRARPCRIVDPPSPSSGTTPTIAILLRPNCWPRPQLRPQANIAPSRSISTARSMYRTDGPAGVQADEEEGASSPTKPVAAIERQRCLYEARPRPAPASSPAST